MDLLAALPQLVGIVEKGGVVGAFLVMVIGLILEVRLTRRGIHALRGELNTATGQRTRALLTVMRLHSICEANKIPVDLEDVRDLIDKLAPKNGQSKNGIELA